MLALWVTQLSKNDKHTEMTTMKNSKLSIYCILNVPLFLNHIKGIFSMFLDTNNLQEIYKHTQSMFLEWFS